MIILYTHDNSHGSQHVLTAMVLIDLMIERVCGMLHNHTMCAHAETMAAKINLTCTMYPSINSNNNNKH